MDDECGHKIMLPCAYQLIHICTSISSIRVLNHVHVKERGCWLDSLWTPLPVVYLRSCPMHQCPDFPQSGFHTLAILVNACLHGTWTSLVSTSWNGQTFGLRTKQKILVYVQNKDVLVYEQNKLVRYMNRTKICMVN